MPSGIRVDWFPRGRVSLVPQAEVPGVRCTLVKRWYCIAVPDNH